MTDALRRDVEVAHCQRLLVHMGPAAIPALLELAESPDPAVRRGALYPLSALGGDEALQAVRRLLHDEDDAVRDGALLALQSLDRSAVAAEPVRPDTTSTAPVTVAMLGPLSVSVDGQPVQSWRTAKSRDILAYLLLASDHPVTRDRLMEAFWPDSDPAGAHSLLHTALYNLRRVLGPAGEGVVTFAGGAYRVDLSRVDLDLIRFRRLAASAAEPDLSAAARLYRGDLMAGMDYPWCEAPRTRLRAEYLDLLRRLADLQVSGGRYAAAAQTLQLRIQADPLGEDGHVALMAVYGALGNRNAALQQYRTLQRLLDEELGLTPGSAAQELYRKLLD